MISRCLAGLLAGALLAVLTACTDDEPSAEPTPLPSPSQSAAVLTADEERMVDVYVALVGTHLRKYQDLGRGGLVFLDTKPTEAPRVLPSAVQQRITDELAPVEARWTRKLNSVMKSNGVVRERGYYVRLPAVPGDRERFRLEVFALCGGLCGHGDTYVMTERAGGWHARAVGPMVIA